MKLVAFSYLCVTITLLVPNVVSGQGSSQGQHNDEDWRKWQSWYLSGTAVSMNVKAAWRAGYTGKGVLVAVVDDGVNSDHPDLVSNFNLTASYDFLGHRKINPNRHADSHGTKCAGIIAGGNNQKCGVGIAYDAQISSDVYGFKNSFTTDVSD
ncbi:hypothetical protein OS493_020664 [Desmophyllum pertusum]|uniref:Peptidase S8/S53 domain-containing protein n=1 Tax=Desmophyllum pertusum TaxID=174260 RepID=A0A9X0CLE8_9CNID|nr:hypothetical protein OS493_020664 [Desmophyllum pertusum]